VWVCCSVLWCGAVRWRVGGKGLVGRVDEGLSGVKMLALLFECGRCGRWQGPRYPVTCPAASSLLYSPLSDTAEEVSLLMAGYDGVRAWYES